MGHWVLIDIIVLHWYQCILIFSTRQENFSNWINVNIGRDVMRNSNQWLQAIWMNVAEINPLTRKLKIEQTQKYLLLCSLCVLCIQLNEKLFRKICDDFYQLIRERNTNCFWDFLFSFLTKFWSIYHLWLLYPVRKE